MTALFMLADTAVVPVAAAPAQNPVMLVGWFAIMIALFYFMIIRPQKRQKKERETMIAAIKKGDKVMLSSGIFGVIMDVNEKTYMVKIADATKVEVLRAAVSRVVTDDAVISEEDLTQA